MTDKPAAAYRQTLRSLAKKMGHNLIRFGPEPGGNDIWSTHCTRCGEVLQIQMHPSPNITAKTLPTKVFEPCRVAPAVPKIYQ